MNFLLNLQHLVLGFPKECHLCNTLNDNYLIYKQSIKKSLKNLPLTADRSHQINSCLELGGIHAEDIGFCS